jgi:hypothetical protein
MNLNESDPQWVDPVFLEVISHDNGFALAHAGQVLRTENGEVEVCHPATELLEHIASEFDGHGRIEISDGVIVGPKFFGSFALFSIQRTWIEPGRDDLTLAFAELLLSDPVLHPVAGPERVDQHARWSPISKWLGERLRGLRELSAKIPYWPGEEELFDREKEVGRARDDRSVLALRDEYAALTPEGRSVVMMLHAIHKGPVLFPMALVLGKCNESEYARGVMAGHAVLSTAFGDVDKPEHTEAFEGFRADARTGLDYIRFFRDGTPTRRALELIAAGESAHQEFKSTLRWNLHTDKKDAEITHASLKTVAAFLNTEGGKLLIGVADNGEIVGIERDGFLNADKFLLHFTNAVKVSLGEPSATCVETEILTVGADSICIVDCQKSPRPVYCKTKGADEKFYVRTGPGTTSLPPSKVVDYVQDHFI